MPLIFALLIVMIFFFPSSKDVAQEWCIVRGSNFLLDRKITCTSEEAEQFRKNGTLVKFSGHK